VSVVIQQRVDMLKLEFQQGEQLKSNMEKKLEALNETLLRISGGIQVLEELLEKDGAEARTASSDAASGMAAGPDKQLTN
jgi:hypothetical protein